MFHEYGRKRRARYERLFTISPIDILEERCSRGELPRRELELTGCFLQTLRSLPPPDHLVLHAAPWFSREK